MSKHCLRSVRYEEPPGILSSISSGSASTSTFRWEFRRCRGFFFRAKVMRVEYIGTICRELWSAIQYRHGISPTLSISWNSPYQLVNQNLANNSRSALHFLHLLELEFYVGTLPCSVWLSPGDRSHQLSNSYWSTALSTTRYYHTPNPVYHCIGAYLLQWSNTLLETTVEISLCTSPAMSSLISSIRNGDWNITTKKKDIHVSVIPVALLAITWSCFWSC